MPQIQFSLPDSARRIIQTLALTAACAASAAGQSSVSDAHKAASAAQAERVLLERGMPVASVDEVELVRAELLEILVHLEAIEGVYGVHDPTGRLLFAPGDEGPSPSQVPFARDAVQGLSDAELTLLVDATPEFEALRVELESFHQLAAADLVARGAAGAPGRAGGNVTAPGTQRGSLPVASYGCSPPRASYAATVGSFSVLQLARIAHAVADRGCDLTAFGFNAALICIATDAIWLTAEGVYEGIGLCVSDADSAEIATTYERAEALFDRMVGIGAQVAGLGTQVGALSTQLGAQDTRLSNILQGTNVTIPTAIANLRDELEDAITLTRTQLVASTNNGFTNSVNAVNGLEVDITDARDQVLGAIGTQTSLNLTEFENLGVIVDDVGAAAEGRRVKLEALELVPRTTYLIVATEAQAGNVDVVFGNVETFSESKLLFDEVTTATLIPVETGVYLLNLNLQATSPETVFRLKCTLDTGNAVYRGSVYWHRDALNSGGQ